MMDDDEILETDGGFDDEEDLDEDLEDDDLGDDPVSEDEAEDM